MARFLQLSDLHVVPEGAQASGLLDTRTILQNAVSRLIEMRAALDPLDGLLVSGDISDDGSAESYSFALTQLERLDLPIYVVPGNHDAREPLRAAFGNFAEMPKSGLIDWAAVVAETSVIGLDTLVEGQSGGHLRDESLEFLHDAVTNSDAGPILVMLHHPPIRTGIRFMDAIGLKNVDGLVAVLNKANIDVTLLAGHVHGVYHGKLGRHSVITSPSICSAFALDRRVDAPVGFMRTPTGCALIDTGPDGVWSAIPLDPTDGPFPF